MSPTSDTSIRVLVVDDHFFTRMGVTTALNMEADIDVVAEADCGADAITKYHEHQPHVALLDGNLPDMHGTDVAREIVKRDPKARIILFSVEQTEEDIHRAVSVGVVGYLTKQTPRPELLNAVRRVAAGSRYFPENVVQRLQERRDHIALSTREIEVVHLLSKGLPNKLIAVELGISTETVKTFVARILDKLEAEDRTQAVLIAMQRGLIKSPFG